VKWLAVLERFSSEAREVVVLAEHEARGLGHDYIGTEHILLGLLRQRGPASEALASLGVFVQAAREEVVRLVGPRPARESGAIPFTPRAKKVLKLSLLAAQRFEREQISPEHLLLGLVEEGEGVGMAVLLRFRIEADHALEALREHVEPEHQGWEALKTRERRRGPLPWLPPRAAELIEARERGPLQERVRRELELLAIYAEGVATSVEREPSRSTATGRAYISGSLTTLLHLGLITDEEHEQWRQLLLGEPPSTGTARFSSQDE
jgi:ATP-dependent Clp protease ATP-binding subunit ClpA